MLVGEAKQIARQWVINEAAQVEGFYGAYFAGSTNWMPDDAPMPPTSDVDVKIVVADAKLHRSYVKSVINGVIIECSYITSDACQSPETMLTSYFSARHFITPNVILDPTGQLTKIQEVVARDFAKREWVYKRCRHALEWLETRIDWVEEGDPYPEQVFRWLYPILIVPHIVLVADLKNPTVGGAFIAAHATLSHYGHQSLHESILRLIGSDNLSQAQVEAHLAALAPVFDVAKAVVKTPFFGSTNLSDDARSIVFDSSLKAINQGFGREEMYWIAAHFSWCHLALFNDASVEEQEQFAPTYQQLLSDLGIHSFADLLQRKEQLRALLLRVWEVAEDIMARNPEIRD